MIQGTRNKKYSFGRATKPKAEPNEVNGIIVKIIMPIKLNNVTGALALL